MFQWDESKRAPSGRLILQENVRKAAEKHGRVWGIMFDISGTSTGAQMDCVRRFWQWAIDEDKLGPNYMRTNFTGPVDSASRLTESNHHNDSDLVSATIGTIDTSSGKKSTAVSTTSSKPLLAFWGFGFTEHFDQWEPDQVIDYLGSTFRNTTLEQDGSPSKYNALIFGGIPTYWRTLTQDSKTDPGWLRVYGFFDIISPWLVGRVESDDGIYNYAENTLKLDLEYLSNLNGPDQGFNQSFVPVVFPGMSWGNLQVQSTWDNVYNQIPRRGGNHIRTQISEYVRVFSEVSSTTSSGAGLSPSFYGAMFDEVNEGTAWYKVVSNRNGGDAVNTRDPVGEINSATTTASTVTLKQGGVRYIYLDEDGYPNLPSDYYLQLAGNITRDLRRGGSAKNFASMSTHSEIANGVDLSARSKNYCSADSPNTRESSHDWESRNVTLRFSYNDEVVTSEELCLPSLGYLKDSFANTLTDIKCLEDVVNTEEKFSQGDLPTRCPLSTYQFSFRAHDCAGPSYFACGNCVASETDSNFSGKFSGVASGSDNESLDIYI